VVEVASRRIFFLQHNTSLFIRSETLWEHIFNICFPLAAFMCNSHSYILYVTIGVQYYPCDSLTKRIAFQKHILDYWWFKHINPNKIYHKIFGELILRCKCLIFRLLEGCYGSTLYFQTLKIFWFSGCLETRSYVRTATIDIVIPTF